MSKRGICSHATETPTERAQGLSSARATFDNTKLALLIPLDLDKFQEHYTAYPKVHSIKDMYFSRFYISF